MAVIVEVIDPSGACTRHRLDTFPLTVGRGLANDLILDDPYVDARHARIAADESGALAIEDLGSVNGLVAGAGRAAGRVPVIPGAELRVGRTILRFRDPDEPVPPALRDDGTADFRREAFAVRGESRRAQAPPRQPTTRLGRLVAMTGVRVALAVSAMAAFALSAWLGSSERAAGSTVFVAAFGFAVAVAMWAGAWAIGSRMAIQRFNFLGHVAVASTIALAGLAWTVMSEWMNFYLPDSGAVEVVSTIVLIALFVGSIAWHLSLASPMPRVQQWRAALVTAGIVFGIGMVASLTDEDDFTDIPSFSGVVKPVGAAWVPASSVDEFGAVMRDLKTDVDEMAAKKRE
jgi:hypothetical protein